MVYLVNVRPFGADTLLLVKHTVEMAGLGGLNEDTTGLPNVGKPGAWGVAWEILINVVRTATKTQSNGGWNMVQSD